MHIRAIAIAFLAGVVVRGAVAAPAQGSEIPDTWITLGTQGGPVGTPGHSEPANVLLRGQAAYLIDAGDGTAERLVEAGIHLRAIKAVFISHLHFDHTPGLAGILALRYMTDVREPLTIYGPRGIRRTVNGILAYMRPGAAAGWGLPGQQHVPVADGIRVVELTEGSKVVLGDMTVRAVVNAHYSFPPGSADARRFQSLSYRFDLSDRSIVFTGDTGPSAAVEKLAQGADLLVSEMCDVDATVARIQQYDPKLPTAQRQQIVLHLKTQHLSPDAVGELAAAAHVKTLAITHQSPVESDTEFQSARAAIARHFHGELIFAHDLDDF